MTIAFDAVSTAAAGGTGDLAWTHTPVGTPKCVLVAITAPNEGADAVTGVTYGSLTLTEVSVSPLLKAAAEDMAVYLYKGTSGIPTGAQTVTVSTTGVLAKHAGCVTLTAEADTIEVDTSVISSDSVFNPSGTLSLGGKTCFCMQVHASGVDDPANLTPLSGWTERLEYDAGPGVGGFYTYNTIDTADVTFGATMNTNDFVCIAIAMREQVSESLTTQVGGVSLVGIAGRNDRGIITQTEV